MGKMNEGIILFVSEFRQHCTTLVHVHMNHRRKTISICNLTVALHYVI